MQQLRFGLGEIITVSEVRAAAIIGLLALGGCIRDSSVPDQPTVYLNVANGGATLDPRAAASMISLQQNNGSNGMMAVDPELMKLAERRCPGDGEPRQTRP